MELLKIWEILRRRKWVVLVTFFTCVLSVVLITRLIHPIYKAKAKLLIEDSNSLSSVMSDLGLQTNSLNLSSSSSSSSKYDTDIAMAQISPLLKKLISELDLKDHKGKTIKSSDLVESSILYYIFPQPYIDVEQYEEADMLEILTYSTDPAQAEEMANRLAKLYIDDRLKRRTEEYKAARVFIEDQIKKVKDDYFKSLHELKDYKLKHKTVNLDVETQKLIDKIATLKTSYEDNEKSILEVSKENEQALKKLPDIEKFRKDSLGFSENENAKSLKGKLSDLLTKLSEKSIDYTKEHPEYQQIEKEIETIEGLLKKEANIVLSSEKYSVDPVYEDLSKKIVSNQISGEVGAAKRKMYQNFINGYQDQLMKIPVHTAESSEYELSISVNKDVYKNLLEFLTKTGIAESMTLSNIRLVDPADTPEKAYFPKKKMAYALSLFLGLFLGVSMAMFMEYIDDTIKMPEDVKRAGGWTILGIVPMSKLVRDFHQNTDPTSHIVEAYRTVRNSMKYAMVDKPARSILVTSTFESEGKSCTAVNIAKNISAEGKRVVLLDLDLRRPTLNKILKLPNDSGFTNVMMDESDLKDVIRKTGIENLDLVSSGPIPPDPNRLIESQKITHIINELKGMYDVLIIDSPPALMVNDSMILAPLVDGVLYVIASGQVNFTAFEHAKEVITKAGINVIGIVLNKLKTNGFHYYSGYYKNGYGKPKKFSLWRK